MAPKVLVIGCGIAGPVLGILLKRRGYDPVVFERVKEFRDAGATLMLQPNGLKVLELVDLAQHVVRSARPVAESWDQTQAGILLGRSDFPSTMSERYGQPAVGVKRTTLSLALKQLLVDEKIEINEGWRLTGIHEENDHVVATFDGGRTVEGSFLIGCDGIKSATRGLLLNRNGMPEGPPSYTGLTQTSGISPTPASIRENPGVMMNVYGLGAHFITYPISSTHLAWAITLPEAIETKESWHLYDSVEAANAKAILMLRFCEWITPVPELIESAERMLKYGLYDRETLTSKQWHLGRCVLVGDAAHPTSTHLGQGANQALEDCYHLNRLLPIINSPHVTLSSSALSDIFQAFAEKRQPRTARLVKAARAQGERRVVTAGPVACQERDDAVRQVWQNGDASRASSDDLFHEPF